ncbi:hypothetical protein E2562_005785 [Oryza meyeriana var. granulata]|uniref:Uncharacterized protein n=1 Tax=Oryza meyeriana var. granulata TaxID=110450 RepID=A0A6G1F4J5_9ORYZ|nr:hypothetical protein E2562_005785 [Oryza meyeriana var. granulata]
MAIDGVGGGVAFSVTLRLLLALAGGGDDGDGGAGDGGGVGAAAAVGDVGDGEVAARAVSAQLVVLQAVVLLVLHVRTGHRRQLHRVAAVIGESDYPCGWIEQGMRVHGHLAVAEHQVSSRGRTVFGLLNGATALWPLQQPDAQPAALQPCRSPAPDTYLG